MDFLIKPYYKMDFIKSFGFHDVDNAALIKLNTIIEVVVFNMLNNVMFVTEALKVKTVKKAHFIGVLHILKEAAAQCEGNNNNNNSRSKKQTGGTVMASEFFGHDSGRFFAEVDFHNTAYIDGLSRGGLDIAQAGGGSKTVEAVTLAEIKAMVKKYKTETDRESFKFAADVYPVIQAAVTSNMVKLLLACKADRGTSTKLSSSLIQKSIKKAGSMLAHLQYVWR